MSTVANDIKDQLWELYKIKAEILNLIDFYTPIRGSMRRGRSRAGSLLLDGDEEQKDAVIQEIKHIN